jgi:5-methylcytosine-specific restriction protein A
MSGLPLRIDNEQFALAMTSRTGLDLHAGETAAGSIAAVRASDIDHPNGFSIRVRTSWRSIEASFEPDNFAGMLIRQMGDADRQAKESFAQIMSALSASGLKLSMRVNGSTVVDFASMPPAPWTSLELKAARLADPGLGSATLDEIAKEVCGACLAPILTLLATEDHSIIHPIETGLPEGARVRIEVNRYERSPANRSACIAIHGARCNACGFDFEQVYGALGSGFIEVHHRTLISRMGADYLVNPSVDLVPLCSNCHSMVHRMEPAMEVEALKELLESSR